MEYKIIEKNPIGKGATSKVFLGTNEQNQKVILKKLTRKSEALFEADILKQIPYHQNIISFLDAFDEFLVFEYHNGTKLGHFKRGVPRTIYLAVQLTIKILEGLKVIHENGILHCDITPHNILISDEDPNTLKIIDFGSAVRKNESGEFIGNHKGATKWYRPPELKKDQDQFCAYLADSSDLYSAACVCLYLINGEAPIRKREACKKVVNKRLQRILRRAVHPKRHKRYQNAEELIEVLLPFATRTIGNGDEKCG